MAKTHIGLSIESELILRLNEYIRNIEPDFNRSQYFETCLRSLISDSDNNFAKREELLEEKKELVTKREDSTKRIALINAQLDNMTRKEKTETQETLKNKKMIYDTYQANDGLDL